MTGTGERHPGSNLKTEANFRTPLDENPGGNSIRPLLRFLCQCLFFPISLAWQGI